MGDYTRLSMRERCRFNTLMQMDLSMGEIAKRLSRHRSTLYRELSRNTMRACYSPGMAHQQAKKRCPRKALKLKTDKRLYHYVYDHLKKGWSPEQIAGRLRLEKQPYTLCHETIYRYAYQQGHKKLWHYLPSRRKKRRARCVRSSSECRYGAIRLITKRPKNIEERRHIGHWEGDLIAFSRSPKETVTTLVERKCRLVILLKNETKASQIVMGRIQNKFIHKKTNLPCKTITFGQGSEFANYPLIERSIPCKVYYCQTRSPWQKGSNENMNGRLRRYLPRSIEINQVTQRELDQLAERMNNLPRKCLGFRTPNELFLKHVSKPCRTRM